MRGMITLDKCIRRKRLATTVRLSMDSRTSFWAERGDEQLVRWMELSLHLEMLHTRSSFCDVLELQSRKHCLRPIANGGGILKAKWSPPLSHRMDSTTSRSRKVAKVRWDGPICIMTQVGRSVQRCNTSTGTASPRLELASQKLVARL